MLGKIQDLGRPQIMTHRLKTLLRSYDVEEMKMKKKTMVIWESRLMILIRAINKR